VRGQVRQLEGIQYLRAVAALMVVLYHLNAHGGPLLKAFTAEFSSGVDIFFVVSGFIMLITSQRATPFSFIGRRIARIVPLYWLLTLATCAAAVLSSHRHSATEVVKSLLFIPYLDVHGSGIVLPIIPPGWSLDLEMYFYVLFAVTLAAPLRRWAVPILGVVFAILMAFHDAVMARGDIAAFYLQPRIIEFWAGMAIGWLYLNERLTAAPAIAMAAVVVGFAGLVAFDLPFQVPAVLLVAGVVSLERAQRVPRWPILGYLGDASYSTYLTHGAALDVIYLTWRHFHRPEGVLGEVVALVASVAVGLLCYRFVEAPLTRVWRRRRPAGPVMKHGSTGDAAAESAAERVQAAPISG
jgi:exopolysaccharide production protein ExoZ